MKRTKILAAVVVAMSFGLSSCGSSDYLQSVQLTSNGVAAGGFFNLVGIDGTLQLEANAVYHSGKTVPVTNEVTFTVTTVGCVASGDQPPDQCAGPLPAYGPTTVPIDTTGLMTAVTSMCTWVDIGNPLPTPPKYSWFYTGYYQVVANYRGMQSQPVAIGVGSAGGNAPDGSCGPS